MAAFAVQVSLVNRFLALTTMLSVPAWLAAKRVALHDPSEAVHFKPEPNFTPLSFMEKCHLCPAVEVCTSTLDLISPLWCFSVSFQVLAPLQVPELMTAAGAAVRAGRRSPR
jgi:hypothetical protein